MRNKIFIGVVLVTPVVATLWIFNFLLKLTTSWFPKNKFPELNNLLNGYLLSVLVLLALVAVLYLLGALAHYFIGKRLYHLADRVFSGIPFIKNIYIFVRQVCEWVAKSRGTAFQSVVLVEYPRRGCYSLGLVTAETRPVISNRILGKDGQPAACVNVFVATTPNPSSGFFIVVPKEEAVPVDMEVSDAFNLIISGGAILPHRAADSKPGSMASIIDDLINHTSTPTPQGDSK